MYCWKLQKCNEEGQTIKSKNEHIFVSPIILLQVKHLLHSCLVEIYEPGWIFSNLMIPTTFIGNRKIWLHGNIQVLKFVTSLLDSQSSFAITVERYHGYSLELQGNLDVSHIKSKQRKESFGVDKLSKKENNVFNNSGLNTSDRVSSYHKRQQCSFEICFYSGKNIWTCWQFHIESRNNSDICACTHISKGAQISRGKDVLKQDLIFKCF